MTMEPREFGIACQQRCVERFSQRHVRGIVRADRFAKFPHAREQILMTVPIDAKRRMVVERLLRARGRDVAELDEPAQCLRNLDVEQMGSMQLLVWCQGQRRHVIGARGSQQELEKR